MSKLSGMPVVGLVVIAVILALFALSVFLLLITSARYRHLASMVTGNVDRENGFMRFLVSDFADAYKKYGQNVNTPAIISNGISTKLSGLLLCERFLNNAVSLFVTLGLFGTFLGLSLSVSSLTELISYSNTSEWLSVLDSVGGGLMSALSGMGVAFYTSLVGAGCSIVDANALHRHWREIAVDSLVNPKSRWSYRKVCQGIVEAFDSLPIHEDLRKPRVGIVGEILVKYMPLANNHLVELLEREGAEATVPDLMDFLNYSLYNTTYKKEFLGIKSDAVSRLGIRLIWQLRKHAVTALEKSRRFEAPMPIKAVAELARPFLSIGNQYGEGWFLTGEMAELIAGGIPNIVCIQPFACLPNHVVGKGVIKALKKAYPEANIIAVDYDPGASEVNQLNRIKLMLSAAQKKLAEETAAVTV